MSFSEAFRGMTRQLVRLWTWSIVSTSVGPAMARVRTSFSPMISLLIGRILFR